MNNTLTELYSRLINVSNYKLAVIILKNAGLQLAEYGNKSKKEGTGYAFYNRDGLRTNPDGIQLTYRYKKVGRDSYIASKIVDVQLLPIN